MINETVTVKDVIVGDTTFLVAMFVIFGIILTLVLVVGLILVVIYWIREGIRNVVEAKIKEELELHNKRCRKKK